MTHDTTNGCYIGLTRTPQEDTMDPQAIRAATPHLAWIFDKIDRAVAQDPEGVLERFERAGLLDTTNEQAPGHKPQQEAVMTAEHAPREQPDTALAADLLEDYSNQCLIIAAALQEGLAIAHLLPPFRGSWLMLQVLLEGLAQNARYDDGREGFRDLSRQVIRGLEAVRREVRRPHDAPPA